MLVFMSHATTLFPKCVLMEISSFAIWDRNKVIIAISAAIWFTNIGAQLTGEFTSSIPLNFDECDLKSGLIEVNDRFQSSRLLALFISRLALFGMPPQELAQPTILRSSNTFALAVWPPTLFYYSSCSLACYASAFAMGLFLILPTLFGNRWGIVRAGCDAVYSLRLTS